ncbi:GNAT family N-acetyltransferase [Cellulophaga sp. F20128]|uniref:GNAT family N-acetyltransferase n=1 Tax=Cellulophaga sp. F20128 TaxID=2926413 RepID=UPI001FF3761E|nr:GNAT family N-acetyltransferase [Cellulophaga sp. F20128]MCK0156862.1 GNAT family N-acetyltransferase [Cellulophaga sp. F20128]
MRLLKNEDFYKEFTENKAIPAYYNSLITKFNKQAFYTAVPTMVASPKAICVSVKLFPKYLVPSFHQSEQLGVHRVFQKDVNGCAIHIKNKIPVAEFLRNEYSKKFRTSINRSVNRFELCLNYSYKMISEGIEKEDFHFLMETLREMLVFRFNQRNEPNDVLTHWEYYYKLTFELLNAKKASMFIISHNNEPIHICINYHFKEILFISIASFNHKFSKFSLGNISIYKILEWALCHNYELLDMGYGDLEYKRNWSNYSYTYENHIVHTKKWNYTLAANLEASKIRLKNFLKKYSVAQKIDKLKVLLHQNKTILNTYTTFTIEDVAQLPTKNLLPIALDNEAFEIISKAVYDSIFLQSVPIDTITVFEIKAHSEYLLVSPKSTKKITVTQ